MRRSVGLSPPEALTQWINEQIDMVQGHRVMSCGLAATGSEAQMPGPKPAFVLNAVYGFPASQDYEILYLLE